MQTKQNIEYSFLANGYVNSCIVLTDDSISPDQLMSLLNGGEATTSIHEGMEVILWVDIAKPKVIGYVTSTEIDMEYGQFDIIQVSDIPVNEPKYFDMSRLARACAVGEFILEPEMSTDEIMTVLEKAGGDVPKLTLEEGALDMCGRTLLKEIDLHERGLMNLMSLAYNAGKNNQEII